MALTYRDWDWCSMCGSHIKCPKCGNNCCTGGYGYLPSKTPWGEPGDVECDMCPVAYDYQDAYQVEGKRKFRFRWTWMRIKMRAIRFWRMWT